MLLVTRALARLHLELRIEGLDVVPSLTATTTVSEDANHFVLNMWHFVKISDLEGDEQVIHDLGLDLLGHVVAELPDSSLDLVVKGHLFQLVAARLQAFVARAVVFVISLMLLFFAL